ncbi:MAG TPA: 2-amino-4-hydroxy-6-hydroxymethyldihydropteridine diphosphokinase [Bryobacteraceae bacterium]|nr:2-amino-4-hydroxy-6-hydroxymethyldihydropteridine diphosphokinase [Bryobacteraceae bacterium]
MKTVYLSLGSNLGDREAHLAQAMERLEAAGIRIVRHSSIYETEPQDRRDQPWFLNMVLEVETDLAPLDLLAQTQKIEKELGRERTVPQGPRTIDIDILFYGSSVISTPELEIPHPRLAVRRFVLEPLAELSPNLVHPVIQKTVRELLPSTGAQVVRIH